MTEKEIRKIIKLTLEEERKIKFKEREMTPFQLTKLYISEYPNMEESIRIKIETIEELRVECRDPKSPSLVKDVIQGGSVDNRSHLERKEEVINHLLKEIEELKGLKIQVEKAIDVYKKDKDFRIIQEKFFNKKTNEEIGDILGVDESTVRRKQNTMIESISKILFPIRAESTPKVRLDIAE